MRSAELLRYAFDQVGASLRSAVQGLGPEDLTRRPAPGANTLAWLAWHLLRVQDDHVAAVAGHEQVWTAEGWAQRFDLPFPTSATGYGFDEDQVAAVRLPSVDLLLGYADAVHARTAQFLDGLSDDDLDRVVDRSWDPPVTLGVRLVSVLSDDLQHIGQAAYLRGLRHDA
jgi:uncharacterized damage-inducible protein DinB